MMDSILAKVFRWRYSVFDFAFITIITLIAIDYSLWWLLLNIPMAVISAIMEERYRE